MNSLEKGKIKANFFEQMIFCSAPWNKMTESEQNRLMNLIMSVDVRKFNSEKSITTILNAYYIGFLNGLHYQALNWRE